MAPVDLQVHSCEHCRRLIIDFNENQRRPWAGRYSRNKNQAGPDRVLFDFTLGDIRNADASGCGFCTWFLDQEAIGSRNAVSQHGPNNLPSDDQGGRPSSLGRSLRRVVEEHGQAMAEHRLIAAPYVGLGRRLDILYFEFFGLWDPATKKTVQRTSGGFKVYSAAGDPASRFISTRPIEVSPASPAAFERLSSWLETCRSSHQKCREMATAARRPDMNPARLVRIIDLPSGGQSLHLLHADDLELLPQFVALSYCWGGDQALKCTKSTVADFKREIPFDHVPPTFQDAIRVCRQAGFNHIWIDALCILQDDEADQALEIAKMRYIYSHAVFTIAASRCRSVNGRFLATRVLKATTPTFTLPCRFEDGIIGAVNLVQLAISPEPIDRRGWTFQERLLSPRTIEYGSRQTRWICQESERKPDLTDGWRSDAEPYTLRRDTFTIPAGLDAAVCELNNVRQRSLYSWHTLVQTFTRRQLTKPTDRPLAISGIAERFASNNPDVGEYVAGLWKPYIHLGLFWRIKRPAARPAAFQGPSWSWTSVNGPVAYPYFPLCMWAPENLTVEVISFPGELVDRRAPFGALRPDASGLRVKGRLAPGICVWRTKAGAIVREPGRGNMTVFFFGANDSISGSITGRGEMFCDTTELDEEKAAAGDDPGTPVMILEVQRARVDAIWVCCGLVLRRADYGEADNPYEGSVFRRVGQFALNWERQRHGESTESWERRIDTDLNWFKNVVPREIDII